MDKKFDVKTVFMICIMFFFLLSAIMRNNHYLNIAIILVGCLVFFIINIWEPIKSALVSKRFSFILILSIILNLSIILIALFCIIAFINPVLIITCLILSIANILVDILLNFSLNKKVELSNYFILTVFLLYLFMALSSYNNYKF